MMGYSKESIEGFKIIDNIAKVKTIKESLINEKKNDEKRNLYMMCEDSEGWEMLVIGIARANSADEARHKIAKEYKIDEEDAKYYPFYDIYQSDYKSILKNLLKLKKELTIK